MFVACHPSRAWVLLLLPTFRLEMVQVCDHSDASVSARDNFLSCIRLYFAVDMPPDAFLDFCTLEEPFTQFESEYGFQPGSSEQGNMSRELTEGVPESGERGGSSHSRCGVGDDRQCVSGELAEKLRQLVNGDLG